MCRAKELTEVFSSILGIDLSEQQALDYLECLEECERKYPNKEDAIKLHACQLACPSNYVRRMLFPATEGFRKVPAQADFGCQFPNGLKTLSFRNYPLGWYPVIGDSVEVFLLKDRSGQLGCDGSVGGVPLPDGEISIHIEQINDYHGGGFVTLDIAGR